MSDHAFYTHPKALVDEGAKIGHGTRVWAFAHVLSGAQIGKNCNICDYVFVESGAILGDGVTVKNAVQIWEGVTVKDNVFLGPNCVFTNDLIPRSFIKRPKSHWLKPTVLKEGSTIGANSTIICGITIGKYAFVGAGSVVSRDVPDYALVTGSPARVKGWVCACGTKLKFEKNEANCTECHGHYVQEGNLVHLSESDKGGPFSDL